MVLCIHSVVLHIAACVVTRDPVHMLPGFNLCCTVLSIHVALCNNACSIIVDYVELRAPWGCV